MSSEARSLAAERAVLLSLAGVLAVLCVDAARERARRSDEAAVDLRTHAVATPPLDALDLRRWSARELRSLPGLGEKRALDVVRARWSGRVDGGLESLDRVPGIGPETVRALREELERRRLAVAHEGYVERATGVDVSQRADPAPEAHEARADAPPDDRDDAPTTADGASSSADDEPSTADDEPSTADGAHASSHAP